MASVGSDLKDHHVSNSPVIGRVASCYIKYQIAQGPIQSGLKYLQDQGIHNPSGQPVPVSVSKMVFLIFVWDSLCSLPLILSLGNAEKKLAQST